MARIRSHATYANVIATLALFLALGGGAYAATSLPKNSVSTKQLKKNAVVSSKVKNGSLLAQDFKAGQLPQGAQGIQGAQGATGPKGDQGPRGATGPATGAAGGDLTGSFPNPTIAAGAVGPGKLATLPMARIVLDQQEVTSTSGPLTGKEVADTAGMHSDTTNPGRITAPVAGTYIITAAARWQDAGSGDHILNIVKNGTLYLGSSIDAATSSLDPLNTVSTVARLSAGDYVELTAARAGGFDDQISPFEEQSSFAAAFIGP